MQFNTTFPTVVRTRSILKEGSRLGCCTSRGLTLIELLIAIALGLVILTALIALYGNVSRTNNEMAKTNQLIENGRFAIQLLKEDVEHAGFWGAIDPLTATGIPDPCLAYAAWPTGAAGDAYKVNLLTIPVQGYADGASVPAGCGINSADVVAKSDVLIVRHANTCVAGGGCDGALDSGPHIQVSACRTSAPPEPAYVLADIATLNGMSPHIRARDCSTEVPRRKMISNIYYVKNSDAGIPTLMRMSFANGAYSAPQALIDGIEGFRVEYGVDSLGSNGLPIGASNPPDGNADRYVSCAPSCNLADLANVVSVKLYVLARNLEPTSGYVDNKSYTLGPLVMPPALDSYKRHVFTTTVRLVNPASRREVP